MSSKGSQLGGKFEFQQNDCNQSCRINICRLKGPLGQSITSQLSTVTIQSAAGSRAPVCPRVAQQGIFHERQF